MSVARCKLLMSYLPGIAAVVNSFQSPEVQLSVFQALIRELEDADDDVRARRHREKARDALANSDTELAHDIVEGESIHALAE